MVDNPFGNKPPEFAPVASYTPPGKDIEFKTLELPKFDEPKKEDKIDLPNLDKLKDIKLDKVEKKAKIPDPNEIPEPEIILPKGATPVDIRGLRKAAWLKLFNNQESNIPVDHIYWRI